MYGVSGQFRPLAYREWVEWTALYDLEAKEAERAMKSAGKRRRGSSGPGAPMPRTLDRARTEGDT